MTPTITAFETSPDRGKGFARDMQVRWALEEVGQPYEVRLVSFKAMKEPAHLAVHPFGQIPTYEEGDLALFESGAILIHIAGQHAGLLPDDPDARGAGHHVDVRGERHSQGIDHRAGRGFACRARQAVAGGARAYAR
jgi:glutathione S-transferase